MKKMLLVLLMCTLCIGFFFLVKNHDLRIGFITKEIDIEEQLKNHYNELEEDYPSTPRDVIERHNEMMQYLYGHKMQDRHIDLYVQTMRKFYTEELLSHNTQESQKESIWLEKQDNNLNKLKLLESKVEEIIYQEEQQKAEVQVIHYLNKQNITRVYYLQKTSLGWKIIGWEDVKIATKQEEENRDV